MELEIAKDAKNVRWRSFIDNDATYVRTYTYTENDGNRENGKFWEPF